MHKGSMNKVMLLGRLADVANVKHTTSGTAVANISMATNESWIDSDGGKKEKTEWHRIVIFGKRAETAGEYFTKGMLLMVEGKLQTRSWEDKDNIKRYTTEIVCENFVMLGGKSGNSGSESSKKPEQDDDLPF